MLTLEQKLEAAKMRKGGIPESEVRQLETWTQRNICPTCNAPANLCYNKFPRRDHIPRCANDDCKAQYADGLCYGCYQESLKAGD